VASQPPEKQPSRVRQFWGRRSRLGKVGLIAGALFVVLLVITLAVPAPEDPAEPAVADAEAAPEPTTTEEASEATTEEEPETGSEVEPEEEAPKPPPPPPTVARVIDGDTIELGDGTRVRLVQIDAPEAGRECYAQKSTGALKKLLPAGSEVRLVRDARLDNRDRFGRLLRYVIADGKNVNMLLVQRGAASAYFYNGDRGRHAAKLARSADTARAKGRGAWGACEASTDYTGAWQTKRKRVPPPPGSGGGGNCHPSYTGACLNPALSDYDCAGGSGNGPGYTGRVRVVGPDVYDLDADDDGWGCE